MTELHINIDHIATLRNARRTVEPSPLEAVKLLEASKASGITTHLREDRRQLMIGFKCPFGHLRRSRTRLRSKAY